MSMLAQWAGTESWGLHRNVIYVLVGVLVALVLGTVVRLVAIRKSAPDVAAKRWASLRTWWIIAVLFALAVVLGRAGVVLFFGLVSLLALREYMMLVQVPYRLWGLPPWMYAVLIGNYALIAAGWVDVFAVFAPLGGLLLIAVRMVWRERTEGYLLAAASSYWGILLTVYCVSHAALLLTLPAATNDVAGPVGWLLYLMLLTELSDIVQALVGRRIGRRAIAPVLSPHKTWEGLLGGVAGTIVLAALLAPLLTPLATASLRLGRVPITVPYLPACLAGMTLSLAGYFGDVNISGVKRDVGVKDSGQMLPGQGGILDRIDSLMFTAPLFYYFVRYLVVLPTELRAAGG
jgi:phosphatidate cytidylyltransferase